MKQQLTHTKLKFIKRAITPLGQLNYCLFMENHCQLYTIIDGQEPQSLVKFFIPYLIQEPQVIDLMINQIISILRKLEPNTDLHKAYVDQGNIDKNYLYLITCCEYIMTKISNLLDVGLSYSDDLVINDFYQKIMKEHRQDASSLRNAVAHGLGQHSVIVDTYVYIKLLFLTLGLKYLSLVLNKLRKALKSGII